MSISWDYPDISCWRQPITVRATDVPPYAAGVRRKPSMPISDQPFRTYVEENLDALNRDPGHEALIHQGRRVTAGEFRALVLRMARALRERGIERGTTVTLLSGNLPETIAARYAANL